MSPVFNNVNVSGSRQFTNVKVYPSSSYFIFRGEKNYIRKQKCKEIVNVCLKSLWDCNHILSTNMHEQSTFTENNVFLIT